MVRETDYVANMEATSVMLKSIREHNNYITIMFTINKTHNSNNINKTFVYTGILKLIHI